LQVQIERASVEQKDDVIQWSRATPLGDQIPNRSISDDPPTWFEVRAVLARDPLSGHVFVFLNKRRNQVKLCWTRGGFTQGDKECRGRREVHRQSRRR